MNTLSNNDVLRQRLTLIRNAKTLGVTLACERAGKHRSYFYYWKRRFDQFGRNGLLNLSKKPKKSPLKTSSSRENLIKKFRLKTGYGKERLHDLIFDKTGIRIAISTIGKVLDRLKLLFRKRTFSTQKKHTRCYNVLKPGQRVQMDIKYVPSEISPIGRKYYQYTVIDECTRMRYLAYHDSIWNQKAVQTLKEAQKYFGFKIDLLQTDNGIEFTFNYTAQLTAVNKQPVEHPLDVYCRSQGIEHRLIPPGEKELNGKVERSHRTDDEEFFRNIKKRVKSIEELRSKGKKWMNFYNKHRRHSGIAKKTPFEFLKERLALHHDKALRYNLYFNSVS